jgi:type II secretory pathway pseudopilin PulG
MSINRIARLLLRIVSRSIVNGVLPALFLFAPGVRAQDPGADAATQAMQQAVQLSVQAAQQANQQAMQATQQATQAAQQAMQDASAPVQLLPARVDKPNFYPAPGKFTSAVRIAIQDGTPKASIFYTLDGTEPTTSSIPYTGPILVSSTGRIRAIARSPAYSPSKVASAKYVIK